MSKAPADLPWELLRATALGDQVAFAELYRLTSGRLFAIASRMLRSADAGSEALQEAFVRIWTQSGRYDPEKGQAIHWMSGIVRHICIDMLRRSASEPPPGPDLEEIEEVVLPQDVVALDLDRCLKRLDAIQSKAIEGSNPIPSSGESRANVPPSFGRGGCATGTTRYLPP
jgi:RNA polymerase sigma-70 factor (ECF subfamily)